ncbi:MAG: SpvB/TcaC N-terminal domain-containing protein, partial [Bacteroidota bacterium]|nr:SpvB/TcaC N-terminal domain-containing protein [Bacteroidota bacterium]
MNRLVFIIIIICSFFVCAQNQFDVKSLYDVDLICGQGTGENFVNPNEPKIISGRDGTRFMQGSAIPCSNSSNSIVFRPDATKIPTTRVWDLFPPFYRDIPTTEYITAPTTYTVNTTSNPTAFIPGKADVSPTGAASYAIPLELPSGSNNFTPSIGIVYNSQGGNGIMGYGWALAGLSMVQRTGKNKFFDGAYGPVKFDNT